MLELVTDLVNILLHLDHHLHMLVDNFGSWMYLLLFVVVFCETGLVVAPFLPGDTLLFAAGALAVLQILQIEWLLLVFFLAAICGDSVNYAIGAYIGPLAFSGRLRLLKPEHLDYTHRFYQKHGGKTVMLARYFPLLRTLVPFVAGACAMNYRHFLFYNVIGSLIWVFLFTLGGYLFGQVPAVQNNFWVVILAMVVLSVVPLLLEARNQRRRLASAKRLPASS